MHLGTRGSTVHIIRASLLSVMMAWLNGCGDEGNIDRLPALPVSASVSPVPAPADKADADLSPRLLRRFAPLPQVGAVVNPDLVTLGRLLFFEPLLSRTAKVSCNSCHPLDQYGVTATRVSIGVDGKLGRRNAPTVYNTSGHVALFWDGRAPNLAAQALEPMSSPTEMGMDPATLEKNLGGVPEYRQLFERAFPSDPHPVRAANVAIALAEFERGLITPARWDRYLLGDAGALSAEEKEGAKLFANLGCMVCHTGAYVGGTMYEKLGVFVPWPNRLDHGRQDITHDAADDMVFKVPSLRNVAKTAPYFHDGSVGSLDAAVRLMARHQLGVELTESEARLIAAWLGSLTGEIPSRYTAPPKLPAANRP